MNRIVECINCDQEFERSKLAHDEDGLYVCHKCAADLRPVKSPLRKCPNDGTTMERMLAYRFLSLDQCAECGGVWTDRAEHDMLQKINEAAKYKSVGEAWIRGKLGA
jgi:Transcription factor zinc-finger